MAFLFFLNLIFPCFSKNALSLQELKNYRDETDKEFDGMAHRIHHQRSDADGMHGKSQEDRKEIRKGRNALRGRYQPEGYEGLCGNH